MEMLTNTNLVVVSATFMAFTAAMWAAMSVFFHDSTRKPEHRLSDLVNPQTNPGQPLSLLKEEPFSLEGLLRIGLPVGSIFRRWAKRFSLYCRQANLPFSLVTFFAACLGASISGVLAAWVTGLSLGTYLLVIFLSVAPLFFYVHSRRARRLAALSEQLPDALGLLARNIRSGNSLAVGFRTIADEMALPISAEFQQLADAHSLGQSIEEAMEKMLERIPDRDLKFFCTAVTLQRKSGGNLAEILDKISHIVQERFTILGHVKSLTGEGRLSGVVLTALPFAMFATIYFLNADYVMVLFTDPIGQRMLVGAGALQILGALSIRQIVRIDV